jgi:hypothetical protein
MKAWNALSKLIWLCVVSMLSFQATGCVSYRHAALNDSLLVSNCGRNTNCCEPLPFSRSHPAGVTHDGAVECCDLCDAGDVSKRWLSRLRPVAAWPVQRCGAMKASVCGWVNEKKAAANPPPWPRFHPVPAKPVFESDQADEAMSPEVYGRFGKG